MELDDESSEFYLSLRKRGENFATLNLCERVEIGHPPQDRVKDSNSINAENRRRTTSCLV